MTFKAGNAKRLRLSKRAGNKYQPLSVFKMFGMMRWSQKIGQVAKVYSAG